MSVRTASWLGAVAFVLIGCAGGATAPVDAHQGSPATPLAQSVSVSPPSGIYSVVERVIVDGCHHQAVMPARVSVLTRTMDGMHQSGSVPIPSFSIKGPGTAPTRRINAGWSGSSNTASGQGADPTTQINVVTKTTDITPTSFRLAIEESIADAPDAPSSRPIPHCVTKLDYEYHLETVSCDARCDGSVDGMRDDDVPPGPVPMRCACR